MAGVLILTGVVASILGYFNFKEIASRLEEIERMPNDKESAENQEKGRVIKTIKSLGQNPQTLHK